MGEGALLAALERERSGRMGDIVATIQAEQDEAVRADAARRRSIVSGGPGTGKTAVALHRAAYLLYTYRRQLGANGVLLIGPSPVFLRYIEQVLPSLGEDEVQLATVAGLKSGLGRLRAGGRRAAAVKGDVRMATVLAARARRPPAPAAPGRRVHARRHAPAASRAASAATSPSAPGASAAPTTSGGRSSSGWSSTGCSRSTATR